MKFTKAQIDSLISISDPDGVWVLMQDCGLQEESEYIELKYWKDEI